MKFTYFFTVLNTQFLETCLQENTVLPTKYKTIVYIRSFKDLMNSDNYFVNIQLMRFILSCLNLRNNLLSIQTHVT